MRQLSPQQAAMLRRCKDTPRQALIPVEGITPNQRSGMDRTRSSLLNAGFLRQRMGITTAPPYTVTPEGERALAAFDDQEPP